MNIYGLNVRKIDLVFLVLITLELIFTLTAWALLSSSIYYLMPSIYFLMANLMIITVVSYLIYNWRSHLNIRKIDTIFLLLITLELIFTSTIWVFVLLPSPTFCSEYISVCERDTRSFLNPFGRAAWSDSSCPPCNLESGLCIIPMGLTSINCPLFYLSPDILIITVIIYALYLAKRKFSARHGA